MFHPGQDSALYEVTVVGALGPVLRHALRQGRPSAARIYTIVRTAPGRGQQIDELVETLDKRGLDVDGVVAVEPGRLAPDRRPVAGRTSTTRSPQDPGDGPTRPPRR
jgi:hypothetical protein